jgi:hypothetical protein
MIFNKKYIDALIKLRRIGIIIRLIINNKNVWSNDDIIYTFEKCMHDHLYQIFCCDIFLNNNIDVFHILDCMVDYRNLIEGGYGEDYESHRFGILKYYVNRHNIVITTDDFYCAYIDILKYLYYKHPIVIDVDYITFEENVDLAKYKLHNEVRSKYNVKLYDDIELDMHIYSDTPRKYISNGIEIMKLVCDNDTIFKFTKLIKYRDNIQRFCEKYCKEYADIFKDTYFMR